MYKIELKNYGVQLTFAGFVKEDEIKAWQAEMLPLLEELPAQFGMLIDMREMTAMPSKSQEVLMATQKQFKPRVERSATVTKSAITTMQSQRIGKQSGVNQSKIFIDATTTPNWEEVALYWIEKGISPYSTET